MPDGEDYARIVAGAKHPFGVLSMQGKRLFAKHVLARVGGGDHLIEVQGMRCRQQDRLNGTVAKDCVEIVGQVEMMFSAKTSRALDVGLDRADHVEPTAATRGFHEIAAPAAQPDDGAIDHVGSSMRRRDGRTASITAALSLSGPCNAIAVRSRAD